MKFLLALPFIGLLWVPITSLLIWIVFKNGQSKGEE